MHLKKQTKFIEKKKRLCCKHVRPNCGKTIPSEFSVSSGTAHKQTYKSRRDPKSACDLQVGNEVLDACIAAKHRVIIHNSHFI
jgi:hypothetical protein